MFKISLEDEYIVFNFSQKILDIKCMFYHKSKNCIFLRNMKINSFEGIGYINV